MQISLVLESYKIIGYRINGTCREETKSHRDYGVIPPAMIRSLILFGYLKSAFTGVSSLCNGVLLPSTTLTNVFFYQSFMEFTAVYALDVLFALSPPRWMSLHGVSLHHIYEHHVPTLILGFALTMKYASLDGESEVDELTKLMTIPWIISLCSAFCESFCVLRSFLRNPEGFVPKLIQASLGVFFMTLSSISITIFLMQYYSVHMRNRWIETGPALELLDVFFGIFLAPICLYLQPKFVRKHYRRLRRLTSK